MNRKIRLTLILAMGVLLSSCGSYIGWTCEELEEQRDFVNGQIEFYSNTRRSAAILIVFGFIAGSPVSGDGLVAEYEKEKEDLDRVIRNRC